MIYQIPPSRLGPDTLRPCPKTDSAYLRQPRTILRTLERPYEFRKAEWLRGSGDALGLPGMRGWYPGSEFLNGCVALLGVAAGYPGLEPLRRTWCIVFCLYLSLLLRSTLKPGKQ